MGSDSVQGAGAPTMFQAIRRISSGLTDSYAGEGAFERTIRQSFLGMIYIFLKAKYLFFILTETEHICIESNWLKAEGNSTRSVNGQN